MTQEELCTQLKAQFGDAVGGLSETKGDRFVIVKGEKIVEICQFLKTTSGLEFDYCLDITAIDWPPPAAPCPWRNRRARRAVCG